MPATRLLIEILWWWWFRLELDLSPLVHAKDSFNSRFKSKLLSARARNFGWAHLRTYLELSKFIQAVEGLYLLHSAIHICGHTTTVWFIYWESSIEESLNLPCIAKHMGRPDCWVLDHRSSLTRTSSLPSRQYLWNMHTMFGLVDPRALNIDHVLLLPSRRFY